MEVMNFSIILLRNSLLTCCCQETKGSVAVAVILLYRPFTGSLFIDGDSLFIDGDSLFIDGGSLFVDAKSDGLGCDPVNTEQIQHCGRLQVLQCERILLELTQCGWRQDVPEARKSNGFSANGRKF